MKRKTNILNMVVIALMAGTMVIGCGSAAKRDVKSAEGNIKEAHENLNLAREDSKEEISATAKKDWEAFEAESKIAIEERSVQIEKLKGEISQIDRDRQQELALELNRLEVKKDSLKERLEKRNKRFKANMAQLDDSSRKIQKEFEKEFVNDMNELTSSLKNLFKNNVQ